MQYKQRLMVFIVGQSEQANEKAKLLNQLGQVRFFTRPSQAHDRLAFRVSPVFHRSETELQRGGIQRDRRQWRDVRRDGDHLEILRCQRMLRTREDTRQSNQ